MNRRQFIAAGVAAAVWTGCAGLQPPPRLGNVMTVRGPIQPGDMGRTLPHEHVLVDFATADVVGAHRYDPVTVVDTVLPHLLQLRELGIRTVFEATPAFLGRDPLVVRALSERSGLHIVTNTGYYGARDDRHLPDHAFQETADELAGRWIAEWREGIDGTAVRPGFIKIGVDPGPLSDIDAKLIRAAAITHLNTGLTIASHTGPAGPAFQQLEILESMGVHPSAWIWVHAQAEDDGDAHVDAARRGAWIELDGIGPASIDRHVEMVLAMRRRGLLGRVLVSQDAGWYSVGEESGGDFRGYATLTTEFLPALRSAGLTQDEVDRLVRVNPANAFRIRVRALHD